MKIYTNIPPILKMQIIFVSVINSKLLLLIGNSRFRKEIHFERLLYKINYIEMTRHICLSELAWHLCFATLGQITTQITILLHMLLDMTVYLPSLQTILVHPGSTLKQAEKLKSCKMKEGWMKNDKGWLRMNEEWRMMKDEW